LAGVVGSGAPDAIDRRGPAFLLSHIQGDEVHLTTGLGIGLLGLASAATTLEAERPAPALEGAEWSRSASISASTEIKVLEHSHRWYNEIWNEFLGMDGEWEEVDGAAGVVLRPLDEHCSLGIYSYVLDEVHYLPVPLEGEVTFVRGWIRINQLGRSERSVAALAPVAAQTIGDCDTRFDSTTVSGLDIGGSCWEDSQSSEDCGSVQTCVANGGEGCTLDFTLAANMGNTTTHFNSECGEPLVFSECTDDEGRTIYCVDHP
jgi:hypothetical protein